MHVLIDARFPDGSPGGIQQVVIGLAQGLGQVDLKDVRITFLMLKGHSAWLDPYLSKDFSVACMPAPREQASAKKTVLQSLKAMLRDRFGHLLGRASIQIPSEPAIVQQLNPDLIHFVHQNCFQTDRPFLFTPHDLQHEYYPKYFTKRTVMVRRYLYKYYAERARAVVCISKACREDVVKYLGIRGEKCPVIYNAPATDGYDEPDASCLSAVRGKFRLPDQFLFYPAKAHPHKNHVTLVRAVAQLREQGIKVHVVCSGGSTSHYEEVVKPLIVALRVEDQFQFLGFISTVELNALYKLAMALVFPSQFEGFGMPLIEGMRAGSPVACSNNSALPEVVGDAALLFDADDCNGMAEKLSSIWQEAHLRKELVERGSTRAELFNWKHSAEQYLALYTNCLKGGSL